MRQKSTTPTSPSERLVKNIRRATRKHYSAERQYTYAYHLRHPGVPASTACVSRSSRA